MLHKPMLHLERSVTVTDVADAARSALADFMGMPPEKRDLSEWLVGSYARATRFVPRRPHSLPPPGSRPPPSQSEQIEDLVVAAKRDGQSIITAAVDGGAEALVQRLPSVVPIMRVEDAFGGHGFAPLDGPRLRLADRVLSLIVADFLTRPDDFARAMGSAPRPRITRSGFSARVVPGGSSRDPKEDAG